MGRFQARLEKGHQGKRNNHAAALSAKLEIRQSVLDAIGADKASVFDAFAGDGQMHGGVWHQAQRYVGCDLKWYRDDRLAFVADNRRVMRAIDLQPFNVFDFDAYGSPWEQAIILSDRRPMKPGERLGVILTEGSGLKLKFGSFPHALCIVAGIRPSAAGGASSQDELLDMAIAGFAARVGADAITQRWQADGKTGSAMRYVGIVLERKKKGPARTAPSP